MSGAKFENRKPQVAEMGFREVWQGAKVVVILTSIPAIHNMKFLARKKNDEHWRYCVRGDDGAFVNIAVVGPGSRVRERAGKTENFPWRVRLIECTNKFGAHFLYPKLFLVAKETPATHVLKICTAADHEYTNTCFTTPYMHGMGILIQPL